LGKTFFEKWKHGQFTCSLMRIHTLNTNPDSGESDKVELGEY